MSAIHFLDLFFLRRLLFIFNHSLENPSLEAQYIISVAVAGVLSDCQWYSMSYLFFQQGLVQKRGNFSETKIFFATNYLI